MTSSCSYVPAPIDLSLNMKKSSEDGITYLLGFFYAETTKTDQVMDVMPHLTQKRLI